MNIPELSTFTGGLGVSAATTLRVSKLPPYPMGTSPLRNSRHPDAGTIRFTRAEINVWIKGIKPGDETT
jgi:hypothetical protein